MERPIKRCRFIDDAAELSGAGSAGDDNDGEGNPEEENEEDRKFIDDSLHESEMERAAPKIKLRRSERKLRQEDYDLILENAGIEISKKDGGRSLKQRAPDADGSRRKKKKKYRDSDDDELDSQEEDFIATSSEDEEEDEISARDIQMKIRNYVKSSGISLTGKKKSAASGTRQLKKIAAASVTPPPPPPPPPRPPAAASSSSLRQLDSWYDAPAPAPAAMEFGEEELSGMAAAATVTGASGFFRPPAARVRPTNLAERKLAPIFLGNKKPPASAATGTATKGASLKGGQANAAGTRTFWSREEGRAYRLDKSGKRVPCEI